MLFRSNVLNNVTEIGLIRSATPGYSALSIYPYERENIVAIFPKNHPLNALGDVLSIQDLKSFPLAIPFDCLDIVYTTFAHYLLSPNVSIITSPKTTAIEWARSFGGVALVSLAQDDMEQLQGMCMKRIADENLFIMSAFIINKDYSLSTIAREFLAIHNITI